MSPPATAPWAARRRQVTPPLAGWVPRRAPLVPVVPPPEEAAGVGAQAASPPVADVLPGLPLSPRPVVPVAGTDPEPVAALATGAQTTGPSWGERGLGALSAVLGTAGLLLGLVLAVVHATRYAQPTSCAAYAAAHAGHPGFGCTSTSRSVATLLPAVGLPLLVVAALAVVWVPEHTPRRRLALLGGLAASLVLVAALAALAYSAIPAAR